MFPIRNLPANKRVLLGETLRDILTELIVSFIDEKRGATLGMIFQGVNRHFKVPIYELQIILRYMKSKKLIKEETTFIYKTL